MIPSDPWLAAHVAAAPAALRDRVVHFLERAPAGSAADRLAAAAGLALRSVLAGTGDRRTALDLLAADGLITLALLAQAESAPSELAGFAAGLVRTGLA